MTRDTEGLLERLRLQAEVGMFDMPVSKKVVSFSEAADAIADLARENIALREALAEALWAIDNMAAVLAAAGLESTLADPRPGIRAALNQGGDVKS